MMTDRSLKRLNNGEIMAPMASDMVCPYSQSGQNGGKNATFMPTSRCATLGRVKNLEMTEYQRQKYVNGAAGSNIVSEIDVFGVPFQKYSENNYLIATFCNFTKVNQK